MRGLAAYASFVAMVRTGLLFVGAAVVVIAGLDWAVRSRRISPFSRTARLFRARIDPLMLPIERLIVRAGGVPTSAPWWSLVAVALIGILLITLLEFVGSILSQVAFGMHDARSTGLLLAGWGFSILRLALIVRVLSSWLPVTKFSKWIRWAFFLTEWMIAPLRRIIPLIGMIDITPIIAWFLLNLLQSALGIP